MKIEYLIIKSRENMMTNSKKNYYNLYSVKMIA